MATILEEKTQNEQSQLVDQPIETKAEKKKREKEEEKRNKNDKKNIKGGKSKVFGFLFLAIIISLLVGILGFNTLNIRDQYLSPILQKIPIVKNIVPTPDATATMTKAEMQQEITKLNTELATAQANLDSEKAKTKGYVDEITRLTPFEQQQLAFRDEKKVFSDMVAANDPSAYITYYEKIFPDDAAKIYADTLTTQKLSAETKKYYEDISKMSTKAAAASLEQLVGTDLKIVIDVLQNLDSKQTGAILSAMTAPNAAIVIKAMTPPVQ